MLTPRERAEKLCYEWRGDRSGKTLIDYIEEAITSAISNQTAALQAALEDLARVQQERDSLQDEIRCVKLRAQSAESLMRHCIHPEDLAAHDRQVAARVLWEVASEFKGANNRDSDSNSFAIDVEDIAAEYRRGEREVSSE